MENKAQKKVGEPLARKIDFAVIFSVKNANPNGDPLNGNRPRTDMNGYGEVSDVCLKRKIRNVLMERGESILVQADERKTDGMTSLANRAKSEKFGLGKDAFNAKKTTAEETAAAACEKWWDVRAFGQVFAFGKSDGVAGVSVGIRGPVTVQSAFSVEPVDISSIQITKSLNGEGDGGSRSSDTMGMKHRVDNGVYVFFGSISPQLAEKTGFSQKDADTLKQVLPRLFEGDASSARPEGSMRVTKVLWWEHNCKSGQYSAAKVHGSLSVDNQGGYRLENLEGLEVEEIDGF